MKWRGSQVMSAGEALAGPARLFAPTIEFGPASVMPVMNCKEFEDELADNMLNFARRVGAAAGGAW